MPFEESMNYLFFVLLPHPPGKFHHNLALNLQSAFVKINTCYKTY